MKKIILIVLFVPLFFSCRRSVIDDEIISLITEAETLFKEAQLEDEPAKSEYFFRSAVLLEEAVARGGINNGYIFYNSGNSWLNIGETGKAILNYKKALKRLPGNSLVKENLAQARNAVALQVEGESVNHLIRTLFFFHYEISFRGRMIILTSFSFLLFVSASVLLFYRKKIIKTLLYISIVFSLIFSVSLIEESVRDPEGVIISETEGRKGDSDGYERSFTEALSPGIEFTLLQERAGWIYIRLRDGRTCWVPETSIDIVD